LMKPLKISDASVDKAIGLVEQLMGDNANLLKALAEKEEEAAGWKMLHEQSGASGMTLTSVVEKLMGDLRSSGSSASRRWRNLWLLSSKVVRN